MKRFLLLCLGTLLVLGAVVAMTACPQATVETATPASEAAVISEDTASGHSLSEFTTEWPQWLGPDRNGISKETGILKTWPADGPHVLWRTISGEGYSGMSISVGKLYTSFGVESDEVLVCADAQTGKEIWRYRMDSKFTNQFGHGTRATPTVHDGLVYNVSAGGKLVAVNANSGKEVWTHNLTQEYGAKVPTWGIATSPLVYGETLLVDVGGSGTHGFMAFNKKTGKVVWETATGLPGYSAPIAIETGGIKQALNFTGNSLISVNPETGKQYWSYPWQTSYDVNAATPVFIAPDKVFVSSGYNTGAAVLQMSANNGSVNVQEIWRSRAMRNHFSTSIYLNGYLYGFDEGTLRCIDANSQEKKWAKRGFGKGSLIYADGHLIVLSERGKLVLIEAKPGEYVEKASAQMLKGRCWTVPTLLGGKLYIRNQKEMLCLQFSQA